MVRIPKRSKPTGSCTMGSYGERKGLFDNGPHLKPCLIVKLLENCSALYTIVGIGEYEKSFGSVQYRYLWIVP